MSGFSSNITNLSRIFNSVKKNAQIHNDKMTFHFMASKEIQKKIDKLNKNPNCKDDPECKQNIQKLMEKKEVHDVKYDINITMYRSLQKKLADSSKTVNSKGGKPKKRKTSKRQKRSS
jgi:hypothetical protein